MNLVASAEVLHVVQTVALEQVKQYNRAYPQVEHKLL